MTVSISVDERGQSAVLAVVLLVGIVVMGSLTVFLAGMSTVDETQTNAEDEHVKQALKQLDKEIDSVGYSDDGRRSVDIGLDSVEGVVRKENTGRIVLTTEDGQELFNEAIGSLVYEHEGTTYAIEAGGVWQGGGNQSSMISPPPLQYNDGTLTLPIPVVKGDEALGTGTVEIRKKRTLAPLSDPRIISGRLVTLRLTSDYYVAWARFFRSNTNDVAVEVYHGNRTVVVHLGRPAVSGRFEQGIVATGGEDGDVVVGTRGNAEIDGPVRAEGTVTDGTGGSGGVNGTIEEDVDANLFPIDRAIEHKMSEAPNDSSVTTMALDNETYVTAGTYYDPDGLYLADNMTVDLAGGNVTFVVDGNVSIVDEDLHVINAGDDRALRIYTSGHYSQKNSEVLSVAPGTNAGDVQIYGTSDMQVGIGGGGDTYFEGTIYAPREEPAVAPGEDNVAFPNHGSNNCVGVDVCIATGDPMVVGAIVAGPIAIQESGQFEYDEGLIDVRPTLELHGSAALPPALTYLNVAIHEVVVEKADE